MTPFEDLSRAEKRTDEEVPGLVLSRIMVASPFLVPPAHLLASASFDALLAIFSMNASTFLSIFLRNLWVAFFCYI